MPPDPCRNSGCSEPRRTRKRAPQRPLTLDAGDCVWYNNLYAVPDAQRRWSITQEVEEVALESLQPAGRFVRREWRDGGIFPGYASGFYPLILHRNLAFFRKGCKAVLDNSIWRCTQEVVRGSTRNALGLERGAWVRLPPSPPNPSGIFLRVFLYFHGKNPLPFGRKRYADIYHRGRG